MDRHQPADLGDDALKVLFLIRYMRELRARELAVLAKPSTGGRKTYTITSRERVAIFNLLRCVDDLFPGGPDLYTEQSEVAHALARGTARAT